MKWIKFQLGNKANAAKEHIILLWIYHRIFLFWRPLDLGVGNLCFLFLKQIFILFQSKKYIFSFGYFSAFKIVLKKLTFFDVHLIPDVLFDLPEWTSWSVFCWVQSSKDWWRKVLGCPYIGASHCTQPPFLLSLANSSSIHSREFAWFCWYHIASWQYVKLIG